MKQRSILVTLLLCVLLLTGCVTAVDERRARGNGRLCGRDAQRGRAVEKAALHVDHDECLFGHGACLLTK